MGITIPIIRIIALLSLVHDSCCLLQNVTGGHLDIHLCGRYLLVSEVLAGDVDVSTLVVVLCGPGGSEVMALDGRPITSLEASLDSFLQAIGWISLIL